MDETDGMPAHYDQEVNLSNKDGASQDQTAAQFCFSNLDLTTRSKSSGESSRSTDYGNTSLMDATLMTIGIDDMSLVEEHERSSQSITVHAI